MAVRDSGLEALKKAAEEITPGDLSDYYIKVKNPAGETIDITGDFTASGLTVAGKITEVALNSSTWTALPSTALTNRNGMGIQNPNGVEIKLNFDNTEPGYVGWKIAPNGETFLDVRDTIVIYAKSASSTPTVVIMEVS